MVNQFHVVILKNTSRSFILSDEQNCISQEDLKLLLELYNTAQTAPVIKFSSDPNEKDMSTLAWDRVREFQQALGKKYDYDWEKVAINGKGEMIQI